MDNKAIVEKIQKLLALANSSNEHEAKLAAARAQELLVKYNLTEATVEGHSATYVREDLETGRQREDKVHNLILMVIRDYFFVEVVKNRKYNAEGKKMMQYVLLGKAHNVEIAKYVKSFLEQSFDALWKTYAKETGAKPTSRTSFMLGLYKGVREQLEATRAKVQSETGLVVVRDGDLDRFLKQQFQNLRSGRSSFDTRDQHAMAAGQEQGRNLRIARGLESKATNQGLALKGKV
jgi:hypothetical protein